MRYCSFSVPFAFPSLPSARPLQHLLPLLLLLSGEGNRHRAHASVSELAPDFSSPRLSSSLLLHSPLGSWSACFGLHLSLALVQKAVKTGCNLLPEVALTGKGGTEGDFATQKMVATCPAREVIFS